MVARPRAWLFAALAFACLSAAASADTVIGVAGPKTGLYAAHTRAIGDGVAELIGERQTDVKVMEADDACDAAQAEAVARAFVAKGVALVLGHPCQSAAVAAAKIYAAAGTFFFATATHVAALTEPLLGPTIVRFSAREDDQARDTADYLAKLDPAAGLVLVNDRTRYGGVLAKAIELRLAKQRPGPFSTIEIVAAELGYDKLAASVAALKAGLLYFAGFANEAVLIRRSLDKAGLHSVLLVVSDAAAEALRDISPGRAVAMRMRHGLPKGSQTSADAPSPLTEARDLSRYAVAQWFEAAPGRSGKNQHFAPETKTWPSFEPVEWTGKVWQAAQPR